MDTIKTLTTWLQLVAAVLYIALAIFLFVTIWRTRKNDQKNNAEWAKIRDRIVTMQDKTQEIIGLTDAITARAFNDDEERPH